MLSDHDIKTRHCPMLGHEIAFSYCRAPGNEAPCRKIFDCWFESFDIREFIAAHYDTATIAAIAAPPPPKLASLMDIIRQAQKRIPL
jgi:hypothetical protein